MLDWGGRDDLRSVKTIAFGRRLSESHRVSDQDDATAPPKTLGRRSFVAAAGAAATLLVPGTADASEGKGHRRATAELRRQIKQNTNLKLAQVNAIVDRVKLVLPRLGELSFGQVVIGVAIGPNGEVTGITGCTDGHSCAGTFENHPGCDQHVGACPENGSFCKVEACDGQACDDHWCLENACDTESCSNNECSGQSCEIEACDGQTCDLNTKTDSDVKMSMSKSPGWGAIRANIDALKANKELDVKVVITQQ
jgi:hypothetical protein